MNELTRPALRWHGGKWLLAPWIISHMPPHRCYVEPFGGAASVLLRKPRAFAEIYNDLQSEVVTLFRVLRDHDSASHLHRRLTLTPFARDEFKAAYTATDDPVEIAARLVARCFMGFGSDGARRDLKTGFRANSSRSGTTPAHDWANYPPALLAIVERLRGVTIENRDAIAVMAQHDAPSTLHYIDPPYLPVTRSIDHRNHGYEHELTPDDHERLLAEIERLQGMVLLSGYPHPSYDAALPGWRRVERAALADGARARVEALWINPAAQRATDAGRTLFCERPPTETRDAAAAAKQTSRR